MAEEIEEQAITDPSELNTNPENKNRSVKKQKNRRKRSAMEAEEEEGEVDKRGICYLSRIPPQMDHVKLGQILSQYGETQRIYLVSDKPEALKHRKHAGGFRGSRGHKYSEGWVEFSKRSVAKSVANMLNGQQTGGRKRSSFYYDIWNIKYLRNFKWDDLTEEIAYKNATREQKLTLELSAAKKERDFYLSKVEKSRALSSIEKRLKKKQKIQQESGTNHENPITLPEVKVFRQFHQTKPVTENAQQNKSRLSKALLAGVFGTSSKSKVDD